MCNEKLLLCPDLAACEAEPSKAVVCRLLAEYVQSLLLTPEKTLKKTRGQPIWYGGGLGRWRDRGRVQVTR